MYTIQIKITKENWWKILITLVVVIGIIIGFNISKTSSVNKKINSCAERLKSSDIREKTYAILELEEIGMKIGVNASQAIPHLIPLLGDPAPVPHDIVLKNDTFSPLSSLGLTPPAGVFTIGHYAATALGMIGAYRPVMSNEDYAPWWTYNKIRIRILDAVLPLLQEQDYRKREDALTVLFFVRHEKAIPSIVSLLKDGVADIRLKAASTLFVYESLDSITVHSLIESLNDENKAVRRFVLGTLTYKTNQDFGEDYVRWREWWVEKNKGEIGSGTKNK